MSSPNGVRTNTVACSGSAKIKAKLAKEGHSWKQILIWTNKSKGKNFIV